VKNEPEARTDPGPAPSKQGYGIILKDPEGLESNTPIAVLGRTIKFLRSTWLIRKETFPFFSIKFVPEKQESPPPLRQRVVSSSVPKGLLPSETSIPETRDSSRELASNQVHLPSQSQISHEFPHISPQVSDRRSNRDILLSVEWSLNSREFLAGSREPTPEEYFDWESLREEVRDLQIQVAQDPDSKLFPISFGILTVVSTDLPSFLRISRRLFSSGTDTPEPGENPLDSNPNPIQGGATEASPESPSRGETGETEGERR